jgi:hypothetical protein
LTDDETTDAGAKDDSAKEIKLRANETKTNSGRSLCRQLAMKRRRHQMFICLRSREVLEHGECWQSKPEMSVTLASPPTNFFLIRCQSDIPSRQIAMCASVGGGVSIRKQNVSPFLDNCFLNDDMNENFSRFVRDLGFES